jgi:hypothetical protein
MYKNRSSNKFYVNATLSAELKQGSQLSQLVSFMWQETGKVLTLLCYNLMERTIYYVHIECKTMK